MGAPAFFHRVCSGGPFGSPAGRVLVTPGRPPKLCSEAGPHARIKRAVLMFPWLL
jgi:hypothetical protein